MLFRREQHDKIASGAITRTIRVWRRAQAAVGKRHKVWTIGEIEVDAVDRTTVGALTAEDALRSGFPSLDALIAELSRTSRGAVDAATEVFRVDFHYPGPSTEVRVDLQAELGAAELAEIAKKLDRMDARAEAPWTRATLALIAENPGMGSKVLAERLGRERMALKADVRKLKRLGLTQSLDEGYQLSPRGRAWMADA